MKLHMIAHRATKFYGSLLLLVLLISACVVCRSGAQQPPNDLLQSMILAGRTQRSLSADIVLTWTSHGVERHANGTVRLMKPNYATINLTGDYPQRLLISDGQSRFVVSDQPTYTREPIDSRGTGIDSPWWGIPFRFFFTQSLNPFGAAPDPREAFEDLGSETAEGTVFRVLAAHGESVMGPYSAKFFFNERLHLLQQTTVQFGDGENAAVFEAKLSNVRLNVPLAPSSFHFVPASGQHAASLADNLLPIGQTAPGFNLPSPNGTPVDLAKEMQDKKATLINFWFYNCAPCRIKFPEFEKLYQRFQSQGLAIVAVDKGDPAPTVTSYLQRSGLSFPVALGGDLRKGSVFEKYRVTDQFPATYLLDSNGKIVYRTAGEDIEGLKKALAGLGIH
jgi:peroxiredoxin/outer membrane lipoprotein-sorting protein